jgi:hypothetical protein
MLVVAVIGKPCLKSMTARASEYAKEKKSLPLRLSGKNLFCHCGSNDFTDVISWIRPQFSSSFRAFILLFVFAFLVPVRPEFKLSTHRGRDARSGTRNIWLRCRSWRSWTALAPGSWDSRSLRCHIPIAIASGS